MEAPSAGRHRSITIAAAALIGDGIRLYRQLRSPSMSQAELAAACGFSQSKISRIEQGKSPLEVGELLVVAHELGIPVKWLVELPVLLGSVGRRLEDLENYRFEEAVAQIARIKPRAVWSGTDAELRRLTAALVDAAYTQEDAQGVLTLLDGVKRPGARAMSGHLAPRRVLRRAGVLVGNGGLR